MNNQDLASAVELVADSLQMKLTYTRTPFTVQGKADRKFTSESDNVTMTIKVSPTVMASLNLSSACYVFVKLYGKMMGVFEVTTKGKFLHLIAPNATELKDLFAFRPQKDLTPTTELSVFQGLLLGSTHLDSFQLDPLKGWQLCS